MQSVSHVPSPCPSQIYHVRVLQPGEHEDHRVKPKDTLHVILLSYVDKGAQSEGQDTLPLPVQVPVSHQLHVVCWTGLTVAPPHSRRGASV